MQVLKQRVSLQCRAKKRATKQQLNTFSEQLPAAFWQPRSYDFNVRTEKKYVEKLKYIHSNPVRARIGRISRTLALEQLSALLVGRRRAC